MLGINLPSYCAWLMLACAGFCTTAIAATDSTSSNPPPTVTPMQGTIAFDQPTNCVYVNAFSHIGWPTQADAIAELYSVSGGKTGFHGAAIDAEGQSTDWSNGLWTFSAAPNACPAPTQVVVEADALILYGRRDCGSACALAAFGATTIIKCCTPAAHIQWAPAP